MRIWPSRLPSLLVGAATLLVATSSYPALAADLPTVAVVAFTNKTGRNLPDIDAMATELLSSLLTESGQLEVVEREKLKNLVEEQGLVMSGLVDQTATAVQVGRLIGAEWVVTGSLLSIESLNTRFSGYGFSSSQTVFKLTGSVRALNVTTGKVEFAKVIEAQRTYLSTSYLQVTPEDVERDLVREFLAKAADELVQAVTAAAGRPAAPMALVRFESSPQGAEVEVDGLYVGVTPLELRLPEGVHRVVISRGGYERWDKRVQVYEGLTVSVVLVPVKEESR